jgi:hypothetical protein
MINERAISTITTLMQSLPIFMGETDTLRYIRSADALPGIATFMIPDPLRNVSLVKFHRDILIRDFGPFEEQYRAQYTQFRGKFVMIFDLQWVDWTTMERDFVIRFLEMVESLKEFRPTHILGVAILLPAEYEWLSTFFQQIMGDLSNDTDRLITSSIEQTELYCQSLLEKTER